MNPARPDAVRAAADALDRHLAGILEWHFSPETGTPFWLDWAARAGWDPRREIRTCADLARFGHFDGDLLRTLPHERLVPRAYRGRPFRVFETGGTTGMPKQRLSWDDHLTDYEQFSRLLDDDAFPPGGSWLAVGPTGPRRLRLSIEHLANLRGGCCYFVDLDPRWVKRLVAAGEEGQVAAYRAHVVDQGATILRHRRVSCLFTTPLLLESLAERVSIPGAGIRGVLCGGTSMPRQQVRFMVEEILEGRTRLVPVYGNTLMGLAASLPFAPADGYSVGYWPPHPRAVLDVVDPDDPERTVGYGEWGRVQLTTLTRELFMPRFLERDEAIRRAPESLFPWDGVAEVRPLAARGAASVVEGVY
jgi:phenylacetate-coenzyme A ligase PaaK-like adenylate-forming protein